MDSFVDGAHGDSPAPRPDGFIHTLLDDAVAAEPEATAVRDSGGEWSYTQLARFSRAFERWLDRGGVVPGDRVLSQLPSTRELVALLYGTSRRGAISVPLNPGMKAFHLRSVIANSEPRLIIAADAAVAAIQELSGIPVYGISSVWREVAELAERDEEPDRPATAQTAIASDAVALLIYTSGSTSAPKAVVSPHAQVLFATRAINAVLGYRSDDVVFCRFSLSWDVGLYNVFLSGLARAELVLASEESDLVLLRRIRETGSTIVPVVPSLAGMITTLAGRETDPAPAVRMFTNTGAALPQSTIDALWTSFPGARVVRMYGQTESKRITIMPPEQERERPDSVGTALPGTRVLILDDEGQPLPPGQTGEIVAVGAHVMAGYWRAPEQTARTFRPDGTGATRLHTGDYGHLDEDGYLYFGGRRDDMFKRKGTRMSTIEIEAAAMDIPGVRAAAALAPTETHDLVIFVESELSPHVVLKELATRLEPAKVPASCRVLAEFPVTLNGKNEKKQLAGMLDGSVQ